MDTDDFQELHLCHHLAETHDPESTRSVDRRLLWLDSFSRSERDARENSIAEETAERSPPRSDLEKRRLESAAPVDEQEEQGWSARSERARAIAALRCSSQRVLRAYAEPPRHAVRRPTAE